MNKKPWFVYILKNAKGFLYTGITTDTERRFKEHSGSKKGAKFFNTGAPEAMVYKKEFTNRSEASKFECHIKKMTRKKKIEFLKNEGVESW